MNIRGFKFSIEATILTLHIGVQFKCKAQIVIKRGSQKLETQPVYDLIKGIAQINETLQFTLTTTMQEGQFEEKKTQFFVLLITEKSNKSAGVHNIDFSTYLNQQKFEFQETLLLDKCPDKNAKLIVNFKIKQIGELDNLQLSVQSDNIDLDSSQISVHTPGRSSFSGSMIQKKEDGFLSEKKLDPKINIIDYNQQIQQLKMKLNDMIDKQYHQDLIYRYEYQIQELQTTNKQLNTENQLFNTQLQAKIQIIEQQSDEIIELKQLLQQDTQQQQESYIQQQLQLKKEIDELKVIIQLKDNNIQELQNINEQYDEEKQILQQQLTQQINELQENMFIYKDQIEKLQQLLLEKTDFIQKQKNLTSGTIIALQQRSEQLEKKLNEYKEQNEKLNEKLKNQEQIKINLSNDSSMTIVEELQSALSSKQQDIEKYESELAKKDEIVQNLQLKLEESYRKELDTSKTSQDNKNQAYQLEKQIEVPNKDKSKAEQQITRLKSQVQLWQSKWENNQKVLTDYNNEVQQMQRQVADVPSFIDDQRELPEQLLLLKRAIANKLQNYQLAQQHLEQNVHRLEQELEVCQYKLKLEQSQQCSDSQFQEQMNKYTEEISRLQHQLEQKNKDFNKLQQYIDLTKQSEQDKINQGDENKAQLTSLRQNLAKNKQQLAEALQEKILIQAKLSEQQKALKEKNQELQKNQDVIAELEQYNIQMEEALSQTLDQYKAQTQQLKQAYDKEKKQKQELQQQLKVLKEQQIKGAQQNNTNILPQQCKCQEKVQQYEQKIFELEYQISELQIQKLDKQIVRNSVALIRTSVLQSKRESMITYQDQEQFKQRDEITSITNIKGNNDGKVKELEEQVNTLTDERIKVSKEYQNILDKAFQTNAQIEAKFSNQLKEQEQTIQKLQSQIILLKLQIGDVFNAAIEVGGTQLVDKLQIQLGIKE